jgi:hypothetical protein
LPDLEGAERDDHDGREARDLSTIVPDRLDPVIIRPSPLKTAIRKPIVASIN